eukprot:jgi/Bigna1/72481/fgenesh1_pg.20_\
MPILGDSLVYNHVQFYVDKLQSLGEHAGMEGGVRGGTPRLCRLYCARSAIGVTYCSCVSVLSPSLPSLSTETYKTLEKDSTAFAKGYSDAKRPECEAARKIWKDTCSTPLKDPKAFTSSGQDLVEQLIIGASWRVIAHHECAETASVLIAPRDPKGVKFVVTSRREAATTRESSPVPNHFSASHISDTAVTERFEVVSPGGLKEIMQKYAKMHPGLLVHPDDDGPKKYSVGNGEYMVGEMYAYYAKDGEKADPGTVIRFFEISGDAPHRFLPGLSPVNAEYPELVYPAYCDHWVSNVYHRKRFLQTLNDVLGFTPKVDFNAGVVAAGEAIIESTVTGNNSQPLTSIEHALKSHDQRMVMRMMVTAGISKMWVVLRPSSHCCCYDDRCIFR